MMAHKSRTTTPLGLLLPNPCCKEFPTHQCALTLCRSCVRPALLILHKGVNTHTDVRVRQLHEVTSSSRPGEP